MALRDLLNKSKYNEPVRFGDSAPTLAIKLGKKLFGNKTTTRTLPNNGGTYTSPTVGVEPQQDFSGLYGTNQNYPGQGGFNYATPEAAQAANSDLNQVSQDDSEYAGLLDGSGSSYSGTPSNHDTMYTMNKIDEALGGKSPEDLWTLRQQLARQQALALGGMLPAQGENAFNGAGVTTGTPNYDLETRMRLNKSAADIFSPQIENLDAYLHDTVDKAKGGTGASILQSLAASSDPMDKVILNIANKETTTEKRALAAQQLKAQAGDTSSLVQSIVNTYSPTQAAEYNALVTSGNNYQNAIDYVSQNPGITTGFLKDSSQKIIRLANRTGDPKYLALKSLVENAEQPIRKEFFGVAVSSGESAKAEQAMTSNKDTIEAMLIKIAIKKAITQANIEVGPLMQKAPTDKNIQAAYKKVYTDQLSSMASNFKNVSPTVYTTLSAMIPKQAKNTTATPTQTTSSGNNYGGLI